MNIPSLPTLTQHHHSDRIAAFPTALLVTLESANTNTARFDHCSGNEQCSCSIDTTPSVSRHSA